MQRLTLDFRRAWRFHRKNPRTSLIAIATLALGIGAATAVFTVIDGVLLEPLPYVEPDRILRLWQRNDEGGLSNFSDPNFADLKERSRSFSALSQYSSQVVSVAGGTTPARARAAAVSDGFLDVFAVTPENGRDFATEELRPGGRPAVLVSHGLWQRLLGSAENLGALSLRFEEQVYSVVGVLPPGFSFPGQTELWIPREQLPLLPSRTAHNWRVVGRLQEGVGLERARQEASAIAAAIRQEFTDDNWITGAHLVPLKEELVGRSRQALLVLLGAVGFLLLVACTNVVNLLLARAASRRSELALSSALGATRWDLVRPFLFESLLLVLVGGGLGVLAASLGVRALLALEPGTLPRISEIRMSLPVLFFALALSAVTAIGLAVVTSWRALSWNAAAVLHEGSKRAGSFSSQRFRSLLVVSQLALTLVLLVGAGLLGRSLWKLLDVDPGFETENRLVVDLSFPSTGSDEGAIRLGQRQSELLARLRALPGVERTGGIDALPLSSGRRNGLFIEMSTHDTPQLESLRELFADEARVGEAEYRAATVGYFEAMGIPLLTGRVFEGGDDASSPHVAVVSQSLVDRKWPGEDGLGKLIEFGNMDGDLRVLTVVGVVGDLRHSALDAAALPTIYTHALQRPPSSLAVVLLGTGRPELLADPVRRTVRELFPDLPPRVRTLEAVKLGTVADRRFQLILLCVFGAAGLLLAIMGLYGVTAYEVSQRTRELGVRVALGARQNDVLRLVLGDGLRRVALGVLFGALTSFALGRVLKGLLFEVSPTDPILLVGLALTMTVVALLACASPARSATRVDPWVALRHE